MNERFYPGGGLRRLIEKATAKVGREGIVIEDLRYEGTQVGFYNDTFYEFCQALVDLATDEDWREMTVTVDVNRGRGVRYIQGRDYKTRKEFELAQRHAAEHEYRMEREPSYAKQYQLKQDRATQAERQRAKDAEEARLLAKAEAMMNASMSTVSTVPAIDAASIMQQLKAMEATGMMGKSMRHGMDPGALGGDHMSVGLVSSGTGKKKGPALPEVDLTKIMLDASPDVKKLT